VAGGLVLIIAVVFSFGCHSGDPLEPGRLAPVGPTAALPTDPNPAAGDSEAQTRRGELSGERPQPRRPAADRTYDVPDAGATMVVGAIASRLPDRPVDARGVTRIGIRELRNQSRCRHEEFVAFVHRLASLLSSAGRDDRIRFTAEVPEAGDPIHYELSGTAYLVTRDGFDQWELFLRIRDAEDGILVWQARGPMRVLRHRRPGQPQVTKGTK